jgi:hypothetical protein
VKWPAQALRFGIPRSVRTASKGAAGMTQQAHHVDARIAHVGQTILNQTLR